MRETPQIFVDAYGNEGSEKHQCWECRGRGAAYDETCISCGGYGWVCDIEPTDQPTDKEKPVE